MATQNANTDAKFIK